MPPTLPERPARYLAQCVEDFCGTQGFKYTGDVSELTRTIARSADIYNSMRHRPGDLSSESTPESQASEADRDSQNLHPQLKAVQAPIGSYIQTHSGYALQIGVLGKNKLAIWTSEYEDRLLDQWRGYQRYAAIARTWLSEKYRDDLNLFLVGPPGSVGETKWFNFAQSIERNELVCRKLVWLPSANESNWADEAAKFIHRTFLASPWQPDDSAGNVSLDALSEAGDRYDAWMRVLQKPAYLDSDRDDDKFVDELIKAYRP